MPLRIAMAFFTALALMSTQVPAQAGDCMQRRRRRRHRRGPAERARRRHHPQVAANAMCLEGPEDTDNVPASAEIHVYSLDDEPHEYAAPG